MMNEFVIKKQTSLDIIQDKNLIHIKNIRNLIIKKYKEEVHSIYLRGSTARGDDTEDSDFDIDFVVKNNSEKIELLQTVHLELAICCKNLAKIDLKVHTLKSLGMAMCDQLLISDENLTFGQKFIQFELKINALCIYGQDVGKYINNYNINDPIVDILIAVYGLTFSELILKMNSDITFNNYYSLIKRMLRMIALIFLEKEQEYYTSLKQCYEVAINNLPRFNQELEIVRSFLSKQRVSLEMLRDGIMCISEFLINKYHETVLSISGSESE